MDITQLFEDAEHSNFAKELTKKYVVGEFKAKKQCKLLKNDLINMSIEE